MLIKVKTIDSQVHSIDIDNEAQLKQLNGLLQQRLNIEPNMQRLIFQGKVLKDGNKKLAEFGIVENMTIHLVERNPESAASDSLDSTAASNSSNNSRSRSNNDEPRPSSSSSRRMFAAGPSIGMLSISLEGSANDISNAPSFAGISTTTSNSHRSGTNNATATTPSTLNSPSSANQPTDYSVSGNIQKIHEYIVWIRNSLQLAPISNPPYLNAATEIERIGFLIEETTRLQDLVNERLRHLGERLRGTILNETERRLVVDESVKVRKMLKRVVQLLYRLTNLIELGSNGFEIASLISHRNLTRPGNASTSASQQSARPSVQVPVHEATANPPSRRNIFPFLRSMNNATPANNHVDEDTLLRELGRSVAMILDLAFPLTSLERSQPIANVLNRSQVSDRNSSSSLSNTLAFFGRVGSLITVHNVTEILRGNSYPLGNTLNLFRSLDCLLLSRRSATLEDFRAYATRTLADFPFEFGVAVANHVEATSRLRSEIAGVFSMFLRRLHFYLVNDASSAIDATRFASDLQMIVLDSLSDVVAVIRNLARSFAVPERDVMMAILRPLLSTQFENISHLLNRAISNTLMGDLGGNNVASSTSAESGISSSMFSGRADPASSSNANASVPSVQRRSNSGSSRTRSWGEFNEGSTSPPSSTTTTRGSRSKRQKTDQQQQQHRPSDSGSTSSAGRRVTRSQTRSRNISPQSSLPAASAAAAGTTDNNDITAGEISRTLMGVLSRVLGQSQVHGLGEHVAIGVFQSSENNAGEEEEGHHQHERE